MTDCWWNCQQPCTYAEEPAWSPDGKRIAYWTNGDDQPQVIRVADAKTGKTLLTIPAPDLVGPITPRWSPDGRYVAVHCEIVEQSGNDYATVDGRIGLIDLEAKKPSITFITGPGLMATYPDWSPDGTRILFAAGNLDPFFGSDDPADLYTARPDGTDLVRLTRRARGEPLLALPTWTQASPPILVSLVFSGRRYALGALETDGTGSSVSSAWTGARSAARIQGLDPAVTALRQSVRRWHLLTRTRGARIGPDPPWDTWRRSGYLWGYKRVLAATGGTTSSSAGDAATASWRASL